MNKYQDDTRSDVVYDAMMEYINGEYQQEIDSAVKALDEKVYSVMFDNDIYLWHVWPFIEHAIEYVLDKRGKIKVLTSKEEVARLVVEYMNEEETHPDYLKIKEGIQ